MRAPIELSDRDVATLTLTPEVLQQWAASGADVPVRASTLLALADILAFHMAQDGMLYKAQAEADHLRQELAEAQRPLDAQMARLNERVIELIGMADMLGWAYSKLHDRNFSKQEDALMLDSIKLALMGVPA